MVINENEEGGGGILNFRYIEAKSISKSFQNSLIILIFFARLRPCLVRKNFQDSPSHRIFGRMHGALNIDENKN